MNNEERKLLNNGVIYLAKEMNYWEGKTLKCPDFLKTMMMLSSEDEEPIDCQPYYDEIDKIKESDLLLQFKNEEIRKIQEKMDMEVYCKLRQQLGFRLIEYICKVNHIKYYNLERLITVYALTYDVNKKGKFHNYSDIFRICRHEIGSYWMEVLNSENNSF